MTDQDTISLSMSALECLSDGVIAVNFDGIVILANPAAAGILELHSAELVGQRFAEVFLTAEGLDEFSQAILDAVSDQAVGFRRIVSIRCGDVTKKLAVTSSYLTQSGNGRNRRLGVATVFSDISEIEELRLAEARMTAALKARNVELRQAYRQIEEKSSALQSTTKKVRLARIAATGLIVALFAALGTYGWILDPGTDEFTSGHLQESDAPPPESEGMESLRTLAVRPQPVTSSISLTGRLAPSQEEIVTSSASGKVFEVHFRYGETVQQGDLLVELDTSEIRHQHRDARRDYITALKEFKDLQGWESSSEVSDARRAFTRAKAALDDHNSQVDITASLLAQGIIPSNQYKAVEQEQFRLKLDFEAARENLEAELARNNQESRQVAQLALDNARERMNALEQTLSETRIRAPVSGIVLDKSKLSADGADEGGRVLARGQAVQEGQPLLVIGDLRRMSVVSAADEVFISQIRIDQPIRATGDGFPGLVLEGRVTHVSAEAKSSGGHELPSFDVRAVLQELDAEQRSRLRIGMSVDVEVVTYRNPAALMVPLEAVAMRDGAPWLRIRDSNPSRIRDVEVETGATTVDSVEILRGIEADDEIVLPR